MNAEERETIISWCDVDDKISIYSTQSKIMTKLRKSPIFELEREIKNNGRIVGLDGYLPLWGITIRTKSRKGGKVDLEQLKKARDAKK
jgi:hypothetical protein